MDPTSPTFTGVDYGMQNTTVSLINKEKEEYLRHCMHDPLPSARKIIGSMTVLDTIFYAILIIMTAAVVGIFIEQVFYMKAHIKLSNRRRLSILQAGTPSVFAVAAVMGLFFPGGNVMIDFVCSVYFGVGLHAFLVLTVNYFGGLRQLLLRYEGKYIEISTGPFCCCCFCLPSFKMTKKTFLVLWYATFQAAFTRPIVLFFQGVMQTDRSLKIPGLIYTACLMTSMLSGMWALVIFRKSSTLYLSRYRITAKFFNFQMVLLIANVQPFIIKLCYIPCRLPYTFYAQKLVVNYQVMIIEFFLLALITRFLYRRSSDDEQLDRLVKDTKTVEENHNEEKKMLTCEDGGIESASSNTSNNRVDNIV